MKIYITLLLFVVASATISMAQRIPVYNLYNTNRVLIDPAHTGSEGAPVAFINSRSQWIGFEGAPKVTTFGVHGEAFNNMGIGLMVSSNKQGVFENTSTALNYAYKVKLSDNQNLSFGVSLGMLQMRINRNKATGFSLDYNDAALYDDYVDKLEFEGGAGILYNWSNFELMFSSPRLFTHNQHFVGLMSYDFLFAQDAWRIAPSAIYQVFPSSPNQYDANLLAEWKKTAWLQGTYRSNKNIIVALGLNIRQIGVGYAYEVNSGSLANFSNGTHEVSVMFNFGDNISKIKKRKVVEVEDKNEILLEQEKEKLKELEMLQEKIERLEYEQQLKKRINELEKDINELKKKNEELFIEINDTVVETTDKTIELDKNNSRTSKAAEYDNSGFAVAKGNYVVIHTVNNPSSAKKLVAMSKEKGVSASIAYNKTKQHYYIYTYYSENMDEALTKMQEWRNNGFQKAWVCVLK